MQALRLAGLRFNKQILKNRKGTAIAVPFLFLVSLYPNMSNTPMGSTNNTSVAL
jgi:hypothetical protein